MMEMRGAISPTNRRARELFAGERMELAVFVIVCVVDYILSICCSA